MGIKTGNPRGRPPGSKSKRTVEREQAMSEAAKAIEAAFGEAAFEGDAHAFLMGVYKDTRMDIEKRIDAAKAAIRYEKPALSSVEAKVDASVEATLTLVELVAPGHASEA